MTKLFNRTNYDNIIKLIQKLSKNYHLSQYDLQNELTHHVISDEKVIPLLYDQELIIDDTIIELIQSVMLEQKQFLLALNFNIKQLSLDAFKENQQFELADTSLEEDDDEITELPINDDEFNSENTLLSKLLASVEKPQIRQKILRYYNENQYHSDYIKCLEYIEANNSAFFTAEIPADSTKEKDIIHIFLARNLGILTEYPPAYFLQATEKKISVIVTFLQSEILKVEPRKFAEDFDLNLFYKWKSPAIARSTAYSWKRLLQIAYPNDFLPWQYGKVADNYWTSKANRISAIRWIVEDYFNINPKQIYLLLRQKKYDRKIFGKLGLSYLYNQYYNSILKSLQEAYPELEYWHLGVYPEKFWSIKENHPLAKIAFQFLLDEESITKDDIPKAIETKQLDRNTFSRYLMMSLFDICYKKNIGDAVNDLYPNYFKPWQLGNVNREFWNSDANIKDAIHWYLKEKNLDENKIYTLVEYENFMKKDLKDSKLSSMFKYVFHYDAEKIFSFVLTRKRKIKKDNQRIFVKLNRWLRQLSDEPKLTVLIHGFNYPIYRYFKIQSAIRLKRKILKRKRILRDEY